MDDFIEKQIKAIREQVGNEKVLLGLSEASIPRWRPLF
jgi:GMP synthase PP-ATPase subunit